MWTWFKNRHLRSRRPRASGCHSSTAHAEPSNEAKENARTLKAAQQLCAAIDRGTQLKLWNHVDRLAESASRLAWFDAPLAERLAKIKLAQGEPDTALAMLDRGVSSPASLRLLRIMCLLQAGARAEAQLELADWSRHGALPLQGQLLSALLDWQSGDVATATHALREAAMQAEGVDAPWAQLMLVLVAAAQGQWDRATARAQSLIESKDGLTEREIAIVLDSLRLGRPVDPEQQRHERIEQMASELPTSAHLIEPIIEAQRRQLDVPVAEELLEALEKAFDQMNEHRATAAEAMARLHDLLGHDDLARRWARRALALNPMSARMALLLNELNGEAALASTSSSTQEHAA